MSLVVHLLFIWFFVLISVQMQLHGYSYRSDPYRNRIIEADKSFDWSKYYKAPPKTNKLATRESKVCKAQVKLAFVVDVTVTYEPFINEFKEILSKLILHLKGKYPGSQFSLGSFNEWKEIGKLPNNYCYKMAQAFTEDDKLMVEAVNRLEYPIDGVDTPETSLTALLFTAASRELNWNNSPKKEEDVKQYKMILIATDERWKAKGDDTQGPPWPAPIGNGYDTCERNGKPDVEVVKSILKFRDIHVMALLAGKGMEYWSEYVKQYNLDPETWKLRQQTSNSAEELFNEISEMIEEVLCPVCDNPWTYEWDWEWV